MPPRLTIAGMNLPPELKASLRARIDEVRRIDVLRPDGDPLPGWKVFAGAGWGEAMQAAREHVLANQMLYARWNWLHDELYGRAWAKARGLGPIMGGLLREAVDDSGIRRAISGAVTSGSAGTGTAERTAAHIAGLLTDDVRLSIGVLADRNLYAPAPSSQGSWAGVHTGFALADRDMAESFLAVWKKGYALVGELDGVLHVAAKESARAEHELRGSARA